MNSKFEFIFSCGKARGLGFSPNSSILFFGGDGGSLHKGSAMKNLMGTLYRKLLTLVRHLLMLLVSVFSDYSGSRQQSSHKRIDTLPDNAATFRSKQQSPWSNINKTKKAGKIRQALIERVANEVDLDSSYFHFHIIIIAFILCEPGEDLYFISVLIQMT